MSSSLSIGAVILVLVVIASQHLITQSKTPVGAKLPPSPPGLPFFGHVFKIPNKHSWLQFKLWGDKYGPIYRLNLFGRNAVVVSTEKVANDLLRERGGIYSSREQLPMAAKLMSRNLRPLFLPYGDLWKRGRKAMHIMTMPAAAASYRPLQIFESERLLYDLIREPAKYEQLLERYAGAVVMRLAYGKRIETGDEPYVQDALRIVHTVERVASPGSYLVDTFPILMYLPNVLAPFKREAQQLHTFELDTFRQLLFGVRQQMEKGIRVDCFAATFLERQTEFQLSDDEGAYVIGTLFEAGSGTTAAAMMSFILAMCHFPEWQEAIQKEVDRVVGDHRMPDFGDMPRLPTVRAVAKEVLRWRPVTAGGVPHQLTKDDIYEGLFLPADTNIHANQWAIHRDGELYPDPETFNPARWLSSEYPTYREPLETFPNLKNYSAFGFGRRICPGMNIAENSLHLLVSRMAWAVEISRKPGVDVPLYDYTTGFNVQPNRFDFDLKARSNKRRRFVDETWQNRKESDPLELRH